MSFINYLVDEGFYIIIVFVNSFNMLGVFEIFLR